MNGMLSRPRIWAEKFGHLSSSNNKELIFYGEYLNNESQGVSDKKSTQYIYLI